MRLLVTRPQPQAEEWAQALRARGLDAQALPLIAIEGPADPQPVQALWQHLGRTRLLMFVSPAAVDWFFRLRPLGATWPDTCLAAAPGPGTARALLAAGQACGLQAAQVLSPPSEAEQFDSESLWPVLSPLAWQDQHVAIVSGGDQQAAQGRAWLAAQLRAQGAQVEAVLSYQRAPGQWTPAEQALAREALQHPEQHMWLISSSQALSNLVAHHLPHCPGMPTPRWDEVHALVTHPRIAEAARELGIAHVHPTRPTLEAVVQARRPLA
jgi:uroporphyrinogen-III synthase